jgi:uncharacterized membrane protein
VSGFGQAEVREAIDVAVVVIEAAGALVIFAGAAVAFGRNLRSVVRGASTDSVSERLGLARVLAQGLEFQLAADILRTAVTPGFAQTAQLAAIAAIRTALNFFLSREIKGERAVVGQGRASGG